MLVWPGGIGAWFSGRVVVGGLVLLMVMMIAGLPRFCPASRWRMVWRAVALA